MKTVSRRKFLQAGIAAGSAGMVIAAASKAQACMQCAVEKLDGKYPIGKTVVEGNRVRPVNVASASTTPALVSIAPEQTAMDPMKFLTAFDYGKVSKLSDGRTQREYFIQAEDKEIEIGMGIKMPAWTYNGFVPGPTLRATMGDRLVIHFENKAAKPHTIHFHGIHPANMDGVYEIVPPGKTFDYEFDAEPFGVFPFHCHMEPLRKHISRGLFGTLIVDPPQPRTTANEMVMVMHGLDPNLDYENDFYAVNGVAKYYFEHPIDIKVGEKVRIYLSNMTEFDLVNNFHLHANMFEWYPNGTMLTPAEMTDTVNLCQGQRGILEFTYKYPGMYLFHAHTSEFMELGWIGQFHVKA